MEMDPLCFVWSRWRAGSPLVFGILCKENNLIIGKNKLRNHAFGWCHGENLICRPKKGNKGVMFLFDGIYFWFHLTNFEFESIFNET